MRSEHVKETNPLNRLMIVDDALIMRMKIRQIAESAGWQVIGEAGSGETAVRLYQELAPSLVTMDMVMPGMDGLQALQEIRAIDADAQVVMVSAVDQKQKLRECISCGAVDFIVKPFSEDGLREFFVQNRR